ncbi:XRE family transcriptional regulator [Lentzea tibetensis]|uniref:XRE family transcriptional regulator n=1 Tax=Lentzea tibetensis TaxID=2591470 RepID=A0A563EUB9_9PSEU|nr:XRE family transcriptional regulator [Lentzea tibetensis]TWP51253.1 XRE family transcriptional regulator [Lentzea tibetensis]
MSQDWTALGRAITDRLEEQGMTMTDLANKSGVSLTTVRELVHVLNTRKRNPRTLAALSEALSWPSDHLTKVLRGQTNAAEAPKSEITALREEVRELRNRVTALEQAGR